MKLAVTILENSADAAIAAIGALGADHDLVEVRAERWPSLPLGAIREATRKPVILTLRGRRIDDATVAAAIAAGIDLVDVEYAGDSDSAPLAKWRDRVVLSHHDYDGMPNVEELVARMRSIGCAHTKIAVTPRTLEDNLRLLRCISPGVAVIGMGERGLYSRILAPFRGSEIAFVAPHDDERAAPGQLGLEAALAIYGSDRAALAAEHVFAIAGDPAGRSLSPCIHNPLFREKKVSAAYTIASFASFSEIAEALLRGDLRGVSVTAPFKEDALHFARETGAAIAPNAHAAGSANTIVRGRGGFLADNTDVDGFATLLGVAEVRGRDAAILGAGGTARAAVIAAKEAGMRVTLLNRTIERASVLARELGVATAGLDELDHVGADVVINTLPASAALDFTPAAGSSWIEAAYGDPAPAARCETLSRAGVHVFDGLQLLRAQAVRQNEIFVRALNGL